MSQSNLPAERKPLSLFITVKDSNISLDLNHSLTKNNQELAKNSFTEIDHAKLTHTPFIHAESLVNSLATDRKPIRQLLAESGENDVKKINDQYYISISVTKAFLQERSEQPRSQSEQVRIQETQSLINEAGSLTYEQIIEHLSNKN
jgi:hypothetical protein